MPVLLIFAVLCAWEGSQWLLPAMALDPLPFLWSSAAAFGVVAGGVALGRWRKGGWLGAWGALALGVPAMLLSVAQRYFAVEVAVAALAGVPVVVVVAAQGIGATEDGAGEALLPAVAGLAGALLLVPVRLPSSSNGWIGLGLDVLAVVLAGVFGVVAHRAAKASEIRQAVFEMAAGNAVVLAGAAGAALGHADCAARELRRARRGQLGGVAWGGGDDGAGGDCASAGDVAAGVYVAFPDCAAAWRSRGVCLFAADDLTSRTCWCVADGGGGGAAAAHEADAGRECCAGEVF